MTGYTSVTPEDLEHMLATIGVGSIEELFDAIPPGVRLGRPIDLPSGEPEQAVYAELRRLAERNVCAEDEITFLGGGMYDHYVPAIVDMLMSRSEFLTPYTPYQPEVSQGGLQVMFEYQTAISELTGLPVSNASVYEGPSAVGAATYMAKLANKRTRTLVSRGVHPHSRETLETMAKGYGVEVVEVPLRDGVTDARAWAAARSSPATWSARSRSPARSPSSSPGCHRGSGGRSSSAGRTGPAGWRRSRWPRSRPRDSTSAPSSSTTSRRSGACRRSARRRRPSSRCRRRSCTARRRSSRRRRRSWRCRTMSSRPPTPPSAPAPRRRSRRRFGPSSRPPAWRPCSARCRPASCSPRRPAGG
ncbi:MAG: hypothetical protein KY463_12750 [Actinobacteria bacterium]|nr:hypothetical protein [Actinomycetota bacterium]